jgi:hypothetical protein
MQMDKVRKRKLSQKTSSRQLQMLVQRNKEKEKCKL